MIQNGIEVCRILNRNGFEAYLVGGCVRDMKMNTSMKDVDITTNALPEDIQRIFPSHVDTGVAHGTISVRPNANSDLYEVTTYRIDGEYKDGRHPTEVVFIPLLTGDLARRDFTINAIAYDPITEETVDLFNGENDIKNKLIRCVGEAKSRFMEDPLRVLRAMRFAIKYGFTIEENTKNAMHNAAILSKLHECISKERVTEELRKMLTCNKPIRNIFLEFSDVVSTIIPEMRICVNAPHNNPWHQHDIYEHILCVADGCNTERFEVKLAALLHDIGKPESRIVDDDRDRFNGHPEVSRTITEGIFNRSLKVSTKEKERVLELISRHDVYITDSPKAMTKFLSKTSEDFIADWIILKGSDLADHIVPIGKEDIRADTDRRFKNFKNSINDVIANAKALKVTDLKINGNDLITVFGIKPGPEIGRILKNTFEDVLDDKCDNERDELLKHVKTLV